MNRRFLCMVGTIAGLVMVVSLLLLPMVTWGKGDASGSAHAIENTPGAFVMLFSWIACGFAAFVLLKRSDLLGIGESTSLLLSLVGFKLAAFFLLAMLIAGAGHGSYSVGFWIAFLASIVGAFAIYLTFNPDLAKRIADATQSPRAPGGEGGG